MNPWRDNILGLCKNVMRFTLWLCLTLNALMAGVFSLFFVYRFLTHLWSWCGRTLFQHDW